MRVLFTLISLIITAFFLEAQIATFSGISSTNFPATTTTTGITVSNLVAGSGITSISASSGCNSQPRMNIGSSASWPSSQNISYSISFSITANTGHSATISSVSLTQRRTSAGPDGYNIQIGTTNNTGSVSTTCQTLASGAASINLTSGQSVTITIFYTKSGTGSGGNLDFNDIQVNGNVLPVEFISFDVKKKNSKSLISFSTASETNNDFFTIERSADGRSFDAIGEIKGAGNSTEDKHYEFTDENPLPGINYYRIKQTDFDGQYSYSEIRSVRHTGKGNVAISPRSTDGRLDISTEMESYDVAVYSSAGQEVARFAALSGHQSVSIDALQAGVYFVKVMSGAESETVRVVKY